MSNVCSACTFRHGYEDVNVLHDCCLGTCKEFGHQNCEKMCHECLKKTTKKCTGGKNECTVRSRPIEPYPIKETEFASCMHTNADSKDAFRCCLQKCNNDVDCQELCIDAYNSTLPVVETFRPSNSLYTQFSVVFYRICILLFIDFLVFAGFFRASVAYFLFIMIRVLFVYYLLHGCHMLKT